MQREESLRKLRKRTHKKRVNQRKKKKKIKNNLLNIFGLPLLACCCAKENKLLTSRSLAIQKNTHILISIAHPIMRSHLLFLGAHRSCSRPKRHHRFHSRGSLFSNGASSSPQSGGERSGSTTRHKQRQPKEGGREGAKEIKRRNNKTNNNKYSLGSTENSIFFGERTPCGEDWSRRRLRKI